MKLSVEERILNTFVSKSFRYIKLLKNGSKILFAVYKSRVLECERKFWVYISILSKLKNLEIYKSLPLAKPYLSFYILSTKDIIIYKLTKYSR